ncbi:MAG TPA: zinc-binding dehydrogenase [Saprospiraceae bacterium]|nr:zinc-binding dehydrogenase [Saprospiraceae bacterium]
MSHGDWKDMFRGIQNNDILLVKYYIRLNMDLNYQHPEIMTSPLIEAIRCGHSDMVRLLLEHGASTQIKEMGTLKSPLTIAKEGGNKDIVPLLLNHQEPVIDTKDKINLPAKMNAILCTHYGPPEVLQIRKVITPAPSQNEILVKIIATSVNSADVRVRGLAVDGFMKIIMKIVLGFNKPRKPILGTVYSGIVVKKGKNVSDFNIGDEVFGMTGFKFATYAEYLTVSTKSTVTHKPVNASFEEAAALPFGGQTAIYFLEKAGIHRAKNPKVLIIGASGTVGTAALQIAGIYHAEITAVCSTAGVELAKKLGATYIIPYDKEDFTMSVGDFDIIFDASGKTTKKQCYKLLKKGGVFKTVGGMEMAAEKKKQLLLLKEWFEKCIYMAIIDKTFPMKDVIEAHRYAESGKKKGNIVLKMQDG